MAQVRILFKRPAVTGLPVRLVFGEGDGPSIPTVVAEGGGRITGLRGHVVLRAGVRIAGTARITGLRGHIEARWDANVSRVTRAELATAWQEAAPVASGLQAAWEAAQPLRVATTAGWQQAGSQAGGVRATWEEAVRVRGAVLSAWQAGQARRGGLSAHWEEAVRLRAASLTRWQEGERRHAGVVSAWQETLRLRAAVRSAWEEATPVRVSARSSYGDGDRLRITLLAPWQEAVRPPAGVSPIVVPPEVHPPCYVPDLPVRLVFKSPARTGLPAHLVFRCDHDTNPPGSVITVPALRTYIMINSIEVRRADDLAGDPLPSESFQMSLNRQSWTWTFSGSFHASARDALTPGAGGAPVELEVRVNGQPFRMLGERIGATRRFPEHLVAVQGRGRAALLGAPFAAVQTFSQALDRTAQQLMTEVLTVGGVGFGWTVDFGLTDWLVPGGVWMHQGTYISALGEIASAVGGYLQPHDTDALVRVLPAWPTPWWNWGGLLPEIDLPEGMAEIDETEVVDLPDYSRIFVSGEAGGITADVTRGGTSGDVLKQPMAVHPLITTIGAAKKRAEAELAESGRMLKHRMTLPVLTETGVIKPGRFLRYYDDAGVRRLGLVRGTSIAMQFPVLTQSLEVDSHA